MATVIDSLIVLLGLDPAAYKRGKKEVEAVDEAGDKKLDKVNKKNDKEARERRRREKQDALDRKKHTDEITESVASLGRTLAGTVLGFESIAGGIKYLGDLNSNQANLGRMSAKLGIDAEQLNIYGKAVEFAGGKAEEASEAFAKIASEKSAKDMHGTIGPLLQLFQQKGVMYEDANGKLRDMGQILDDLSRKTANMKDQDRAFLFSQAGIPAGVINRMLEISALQDEQIAKARVLNAVSVESAKHAEELQESWRGVSQAVDRAGNAILELISKPTKGALDVVAAYLGGTTLSGQSRRDFFGGASTDDRARAAREKYGNVALEKAQAAQGTGLLAPRPGSMAARNNNPGNLKDKQGHFRVFATLAEGQAAMRSDIEAKVRKGFDTIASIITRYEGTDGKKDPYTLAAYIARAVKLTGKGANEKLTAADLPALLNAMVAVESKLPDSAVRVPSGATPSIVGAGKIDRSGAGGATNTTTVNVGKIEVNSANADPTAVANQTGDALQRKVTVAQANAGQS